jgi:hypothetical protein
MALRVGQVGALESHVDARARDIEAQMTDEERFSWLVSVTLWIARGMAISFSAGPAGRGLGGAVG